jgi:putative nucleotidyltransferase with HDIG domain
VPPPTLPTPADRLQRTLAALNDASDAMLRAVDEAGLLAATAQGVTRTGHYPLVWLGLVDEGDAEHRVRVVASAGPAQGYLDGLEVRAKPGPFGDGPTGRAIRSGTVQVNNDADRNPDFAPWSARARAHGLAASVSLPLRLEGRSIGALMVYAAEPDAFHANEVALFVPFVNGLALALGAFRSREALRTESRQRAAAAQTLEHVLEAVIETLADAMAERDPYTVGHQRRVAEISLALAHRLGLDAERCRVLRLAALVHDIGKIRVPLELLTKPTRLRPQEFAVIQQHAQATIDILGRIAWPWPLQEIAGQHHERLDGSGYPAGLSGAQIRLESRILAVADLLESMSADRPYRAAVGMAEALAVLRRERGTRLDADVVDAALALYGAGGAGAGSAAGSGGAA